MPVFTGMERIMLAHRELTTPRPFRIAGLPLDSFFGNLEGRDTTVGQPHLELHEESEKFTLRAELPGIREEELKIQIQDDRLTLEIVPLQEGSDAHRFSGCKRSIRFKTSLNPNGATAELARGILQIHLPKTASAVPRTLTINSLP